MRVQNGQFYLEWRARREPPFVLREDLSAPPERLLQRIWYHQRLDRDRLALADGRPLRVLHPGFWNHEAGPDFRDAIVQVGQEPPRHGDIEIDLSTSGWRGHGHDRNPAFARVVLHVVWEAEGSTELPTLRLQPALDAPLLELAQWLDSEGARGVAEEWIGQCAAPLLAWPRESLLDLLRQAALARLRRKASDFLARARQAGWEQSLWEGLLRALGYKNNVWPMQRLGELKPRLQGAALGDDPVLAWQARLLGVSGLLPADLTRQQRRADDYLRRVWDQWWRERDQFGDCVLPSKLWHLAGLRPANRPERRLALAAHWWAENQLVRRLEAWFAGPCADGELLPSLLKAFEVPKDDFWSRHWTLRSPDLTAAQPLLGEARVTDLAVNVVLPWFWVRAHEAGQQALEAEAERRYLAWRPAEDNAVLKQARARVLGGMEPRVFSTAALQQGLLQIVRDFCDHSDALCAGCPLPGLAKVKGAEGN